MDGYRRVGETTLLNDSSNYAVIGVSKDDRSEHLALTGTYDECDAYAQRNESPDNWERYYVAELI